jgi:hypothetical protein
VFVYRTTDLLQVLRKETREITEVLEVIIREKD